MRFICRRCRTAVDGTAYQACKYKQSLEGLHCERCAFDRRRETPFVPVYDTTEIEDEISMFPLPPGQIEPPNVRGQGELPDSNPKTAMGAMKDPVNLIPASSMIATSYAHLEGKDKYGENNWRVSGASMSVYIAAIERHLQRLKDGEDFAADSGCLHLAHINASTNVLMDAAAAGKLNDDRAHPLLDKKHKDSTDEKKYGHLVFKVTPWEKKPEAKCTTTGEPIDGR